MSQLARYARACTNVGGFNERNFLLTSKLLKQGFLFHKLRKTFTKFFHRNRDILYKYKTQLKELLNNGIAHPQYYRDVVNKIRRIKGSDQFPDIIAKVIRKFRKRGYSPDILQWSTCMAVGQSTVDRYSFLFSCATTWRRITIWTFVAKSTFLWGRSKWDACYSRVFVVTTFGVISLFWHVHWARKSLRKLTLCLYTVSSLEKWWRASLRLCAQKPV